MSITLALVTFSPNTTIKSADVNANFQQILNASKFYGDHGTTNNINVFIDFEDGNTSCENGNKYVQHCRHRISPHSQDRGLCFSVFTSGNLWDSMLFDERGHCHFRQGHPRDRWGNHCGSHNYFQGYGSGIYSHGFSGITPLTLTITINDSNGPTPCSFYSLGSSTCHVHEDSPRNFDGMCHHYDDNDGNN